jgi:hypothetical protein
VRVCETRGRGFASCQARQIPALVVRLVGHPVSTREVGGSSPSEGANVSLHTTRPTNKRLADVLNLQALNVGWYHRRCGGMAQGASTAMTRHDDPTENGRHLVLHRMQNPVSALAETISVTRVGEEQAPQTRSRGPLSTQRRAGETT